MQKKEKSRSPVVNVRDSEGGSDNSDSAISMVKSLHDFKGKFDELHQSYIRKHIGLGDS